MNEKTVGELWSMAQRNRIMREYKSERRWKMIRGIIEKTALVLFAAIAAWCVAEQIKLIGAIIAG